MYGRDSIFISEGAGVDATGLYISILYCGEITFRRNKPRRTSVQTEYHLSRYHEQGAQRVRGRGSFGS